MRLGCKNARVLSWMLPVALLLLTGCGSFRISGALNPASVSVANGTVSFVQFTAIFDNNMSMVNVTVVTLSALSGNTTLTFCGNQSSQFTMSTSVQISFTPSQPCSTLVAVIVR